MVALGLAALLATASAQPDYAQLWTDFKAEYGREYNGEEEMERFQIFKANVDEINAVNDSDLGYKMGIDPFTDLTVEEFVAQYTGRESNPSDPFGDFPDLGEPKYNDETLADELDWEKRGAVVPVKNQGSCGSCWAHGTTGSLEATWFIKMGTLTSLSEQQLLDCDKRDNACGGGLEKTAISKYVPGAGMCSEASYPYKAKKGSCQRSSCTEVIPAGGITGFTGFISKTVEAHMQALQITTLNVGVAAGSMKGYMSGIFTGCKGGSINHAVLLVGYGTDNGKDYWRIKNSWGTSFGEAGYIRVTRTGNPCSMLKETGYPVVGKSDMIV